MSNETLIFPVGEFSGLWCLSTKDYYKIFLSWNNITNFILNNIDNIEDLKKYEIVFHNLVSDKFFRLVNPIEYFTQEQQPIFWYINEEIDIDEN